jgi:hypothetical protein
MNQPTNDNDPEIENSPLCEKVTRDGITVDVQIYRLVGRYEGWSLEVVDEEGSSTVWDDRFATDVAAYAEFERTIDEEGIETFLTGRQ